MATISALRGLINNTLNSYLGLTEKPLTAEMVRKIVREELSGQS